MDGQKQVEELEQKKKAASKQPDKKERLRKVAGIVLLVVGVTAIASAVFVPYINKKRNEKDIAAIRDGQYAQPKEATGNSVTSSAVNSEDQEVSAQAVEASERDKKMDAILSDHTRIGIVEIEKIDVLYAIVEGTEDEQINRAVGHVTSSAGIGQAGNCVIAGHRGGYYGTFFERLPELEYGDEIVLTDVNGKEYYYVVYDKKTVDPPDWSVTENLINKQDETMHTLTMITCEDDTRKRIVVFAALYQP